MTSVDPSVTGVAAFLRRVRAGAVAGASASAGVTSTSAAAGGAAATFFFRGVRLAFTASLLAATHHPRVNASERASLPPRLHLRKPDKLRGHLIRRQSIGFHGHVGEFVRAFAVVQQGT